MKSRNVGVKQPAIHKNANVSAAVKDVHSCQLSSPVGFYSPCVLLAHQWGPLHTGCERALLLRPSQLCLSLHGGSTYALAAAHLAGPCLFPDKQNIVLKKNSKVYIYLIISNSFVTCNNLISISVHTVSMYWVQSRLRSLLGKQTAPHIFLSTPNTQHVHQTKTTLYISWFLSWNLPIQSL